MAVELFIDDVWTDAKGHCFRRIVAHAGGRVMYSRGGNLSRWCKVRTFQIWVRNRKAQLTRRAGEVQVCLPKHRPA